MIVLGLDTATLASAVGLRLADGSIFRVRDEPGAGDRPGHATRLLAMAGELLAAAGVNWSELDRIAVGLGPGRFTGLRVGVATARGLAQSLQLEIVGVSSLRALAHAARAEQGQGQGVLAVIDALRGEAFAGAYPGDDELPNRQAMTRELVFEQPLAPDDLEGVLARIEERGEPPGQRWLAVGDGALRFRAELQAAGASVADEDSPLHLVDGGAVCELGASTPAAGAHEQILPDYRRTPDAALSRERAVTLEGART
jgi:tRNA threonylcarbamoyladenosine biosynthesis protein TsaB